MPNCDLINGESGYICASAIHYEESTGLFKITRKDTRSYHDWKFGTAVIRIYRNRDILYFSTMDLLYDIAEELEIRNQKLKLTGFELVKVFFWRKIATNLGEEVLVITPDSDIIKTIGKLGAMGKKPYSDIG